MALIAQPGPNPTRKLWAVIISGGITSMIVIAVSTAMPDLDTTALSEGLRTFLEVGLVYVVSVVSGYMTKSRAPK